LDFAAKIRQQTTAYKYEGNLTKDAKSLGLRVDQLNEVVKCKAPITSIARELFKQMVPEHRRQVDRWNDLDPDVLVKETILISMSKNKPST
jgi:hypothetical protein